MAEEDDASERDKERGKGAFEVGGNLDDALDILGKIPQIK